jgi:hypothetical protein
MLLLRFSYGILNNLLSLNDGVEVEILSRS